MPPSSTCTAVALSVVCYILAVSTTIKVSSFSPPRGTTLQLHPQSFISTSVHNAYQYNIISSSRYKSTTCRCGYQSSLKSSIEDTIETSDSDQGRGDNVDNNDALRFGSASDAAKANTNALDVIISGESSGVASIEGSSTKQQQIQDVLSSPELLDPASILDATIGNTLPPSTSKEEKDVEKEVPELVTTNLFDTAVDDRNSTSEVSTSSKAVSPPSTLDSPPSTLENVAVAKSKEEDLELTRLAILKHINRYDLSMNQFDNEEDIDELGETAQYLDNLDHQNIEFEKDIDKLSEIQVAKKPTEKLTAPSIQKILRYTIPGKSAFVLFYHVNSSVQYDVSTIGYFF